MAWNDIDWADVRTGWQREQRAERAQSEQTVQNSVHASAQIRQERERSREFDASIEERKREFDARLPIIQEQIKSAQDVNSDKMLFPILMNKLVNEQTTIEEAASTLRTVPARQNLMTMAAQLGWTKARNNAQASILKDEATVFTEFPEATADLDRFKPFSHERTEAMATWLAKAREKASQRELQTYRVKAEILGDERRMTEDVKGGWREAISNSRWNSATGTADQLDAGGNVIAKHFVDQSTGQAIPGWRAVPTKTGWRAIQAGPKGDVGSLTPSQNISRLKAMAAIEQANFKSLEGEAAEASQQRLLEIQDELSQVGLKQPSPPAPVGAGNTGQQHGPPAPTGGSPLGPKDYSGYGPAMVDDNTGKTWRLRPGGDAKRAEDYEEAQ